jgi:hypothetical protein
MIIEGWDMGLFGRSKPSAPLARVRIMFPDDFEANSSVSVIIEGTIPPDMEMWVWDLFYAKTLYTLGQCESLSGRFFIQHVALRSAAA